MRRAFGEVEVAVDLTVNGDRHSENAIVCGTFHTDSLHASLPSEELQAQMAASIALRRIADAGEIVGTALYLASDASS